MSKFINLNGKRLMTRQKIEISRLNIEEIVEPSEDAKHFIECKKDEDYFIKADLILDNFGILEGDYVHVNGVEYNLVIALVNKAPGVNFIYSKMCKNFDGKNYNNHFEYFVNIFKVKIVSIK